MLFCRYHIYLIFFTDNNKSLDMKLGSSKYDSKLFFQRICPNSVNMNVGNNQWQSSAAAMCELDNLQLRANQVVGKYKQIQNHI